MLGAQIELAEIVEGVSGKDVCTLQVRFDPDSIETPVVNRSPLTYTFMAGGEILEGLQSQLERPAAYLLGDIRTSKWRSASGFQGEIKGHNFSSAARYRQTAR